VRLVRSGGSFTGLYSADETTWTKIAIISILSPAAYFAGLPICSHEYTQLAMATIDSVVIQ